MVLKTHFRKQGIRVDAAKGYPQKGYKNEARPRSRETGFYYEVQHIKK